MTHFWLILGAFVFMFLLMLLDGYLYRKQIQYLKDQIGEK